MMTNALTVLAECVDVRTGKRFLRGDVFDPAPTALQANRLIAAGCLPETARAEAEQAEAEDLAKAQAEAEARKQAEAQAAALVNARTAKSAAEREVEIAEASFAQAVSKDEKSAADKVLTAAKAKAKVTSDALVALTK